MGLIESVIFHWKTACHTDSVIPKASHVAYVIHIYPFWYLIVLPKEPTFHPFEGKVITTKRREGVRNDGVRDVCIGVIRWGFWNAYPNISIGRYNIRA